MKTLILLRHADAAWDDAQNDFDRRLSTNGEQSIASVGQQLQDLSVKPDLILSSSSLRTITTAKAISEWVDYSPDKIKDSAQLYLADATALRAVIDELPDQIQTVVVAAHNPGISALAGFLTGEHVGSIVACGAYAIDFELDTWQAIDACTGTCRFYCCPESHRAKNDGRSL